MCKPSMVHALELRSFLGLHVQLYHGVLCTVRSNLHATADEQRLVLVVSDSKEALDRLADREGLSLDSFLASLIGDASEDRATRVAGKHG